MLFPELFDVAMGNYAFHFFPLNPDTLRFFMCRLCTLDKISSEMCNMVLEYHVHNILKVVKLKGTQLGYLPPHGQEFFGRRSFGFLPTWEDRPVQVGPHQRVFF